MWVVALNVGLDGSQRAYGTGDEIAHRRLGGLFGRDLAGAELLFYERVVMGELFEITAAATVTAAVADVNEPEGDGVGGAGVGVAVAGRSVEKRDQCGAHAGELRGLAGLLVDGLIGGLNGSIEACLWTGLDAATSRWNNVREEGVGGEMAGDFAARGSAHAVANDEGAKFG